MSCYKLLTAIAVSALCILGMQTYHLPSPSRWALIHHWVHAYVDNVSRAFTVFFTTPP